MRSSREGSEAVDDCKFEELCKGSQVPSLTGLKDILPIRLRRKIRAFKHTEESMDAVIPNMAHLLLQYGVSMECYHEIMKIIGGL